MDIDGLETMGNMMAMIHHDAPLDYFAGWQTRIPPCGSRQKQRLMPKIQLIYSKPNCGEILTSLDFWVVSFRKSNIPMENPPFIYFDDFPIHIAHQLRGFRKKSWLVVGLCQLCPNFWWRPFWIIPEWPNHQALTAPERLWPSGRFVRLANLFGSDFRWPAGLVGRETQARTWTWAEWPWTLAEWPWTLIEEGDFPCCCMPSHIIEWYMMYMYDVYDMLSIYTYIYNII